MYPFAEQMATRPLIDRLKALADVLPDAAKVGAADAPGLLTALVHYAEHGDPILEAAAGGAQALADFYHDHLVKIAEDAGAEAPVKGAPVTTTPPAPAGPVGVPAGQAVTAAQVERLIADGFQKLVQSLGAEAAAAERPTGADVKVSETAPDAEAPATGEPPAHHSLSSLFGRGS